jgi:hypothetical protein
VKIDEVIINERPMGLLKTVGKKALAQLPTFAPKAAAKAAGELDTGKKANTLWKAFNKELGKSGIDIPMVSHLANFLKRYGVNPALVYQIAGPGGTITASAEQPVTERPSVRPRSAGGPGARATGTTQPVTGRPNQGSSGAGGSAAGGSASAPASGPAPTVQDRALSNKEVEQIIIRVIQSDPNLKKSDSEKIPGAVIDAVKGLSPEQKAALAKALTK